MGKKRPLAISVPRSSPGSTPISRPRRKSLKTNRKSWRVCATRSLPSCTAAPRVQRPPVWVLVCLAQERVHHPLHRELAAQLSRRSTKQHHSLLGQRIAELLPLHSRV